ncbi:uncharacterized protein LOC127284966 [Leptopilina boulardi]|uniref:uncharacterized protein LOC127284966 n=1 Tax=Leptopilina boulardi TaxID=63433 RepID=UPI0021F5E444|nr:uncharacterized protein LOC127284966 [Leptopilina boulardi]
MQLLFVISVFLTHFYQTSSGVASSLQCPKHMKPFLISENSEKKYCDCDKTFLYNPKDDSCYDAYRQGPCPSGYYFALSPGENVATCKRNPCRIDGLVPFKGKCHFLWESGVPCKNTDTYLGINNNFQVECSRTGYNGWYYDWKTSKSCPKDSLLMPTNDEHTHYFCKCKETYIYSAKNKSCHLAYRQGPCPTGSYYVLPQGQKEPICEKNPCHEDGLVPFQGDCHKIYEYGHPCTEKYTQLTVTTKTFKLECIYNPPPSMGGGGIINAPLKVCPPGSRRVVKSCKKMFQ